MPRRFSPILLSLALLTVLGGRASATSMHPFSLDELIYVADQIVVGEVVQVEARFAREGRAIYTYVDVAVTERLKGQPAGEILTVWVLGGEVGDVGLSVAGTPEFDVGEEVVLFLEDTARGPSVLGWQQGKFALLFDRDRGDRVARRTMPGAPALLRDLGDEPPTLDELRTAIVEQVVSHHVPVYRDIPGLLPHKRAAFRAHHGLDEEGTP
jgi:hypothetical protein